MGFSAVAALLFALFARSFGSTMIFVGLSQGGTYTPTIMLVAANADPARRQWRPRPPRDGRRRC